MIGVATESDAKSAGNNTGSVELPKFVLVPHWNHAAVAATPGVTAERIVPEVVPTLVGDSVDTIGGPVITNVCSLANGEPAKAVSIA